jgi:hypothetical protein
MNQKINFQTKAIKIIAFLGKLTHCFPLLAETSSEQNTEAKLSLRLKHHQQQTSLITN